MLELINNHLNKYPLMEARDLIKLLYQNEFGGGHMIVSSEASFKRLQEESEQLDEYVLEVEEVGNGLVRVYFGNLDDLSLITLNQLFVYSANHTKGSIVSFCEKLEALKQACLEGKVNFDHDVLNQAIDEYEQLNYPPISHSKQYRDNYQPHYRIIKKEVFSFYHIIKKINELLENKETLNIAIDGKCGAGKTTLGNLIGTVFVANVFRMDDFFLQPFQRTEARLYQPGGNVDYERFFDQVIKPLKQNQSVFYQRFDCSKMSLDENINEIKYRKINVIEGTYSMHPYFGDFYDYKIVLNIDDKTQEQRILKRNGPVMLQKFKKIWIPLENKYFNEYLIFKQADYLFIN